MGETLRFDFLTTGAEQMARNFRNVGDTSAAAARGARVLQDTIERLGQKENRTAEESARLAKALRLTGDAEDRAAAKALAADIAIRRLADAEQKAARDAGTAESRISRLGKALDGLKAPGLGTAGLLLSPSLIPAAGVLASGVAAVGVSFGAAALGAGLFGAMVKTVFANASKDNAKLQTAQKQLAAAEIARAQATTKAQRAAADKKILSLRDTIAQIRSEGAAYNQVLDQSKAISTQWKVISAQVAAPVLVPFLDAVSRSLTHLKPLMQPVAALFRSWGQDLDRYFSSRRGSAELTRIATALGQFSTDQLSAIGVFISDIAKGVFNLGKDVAAHNPDFGVFATRLDQWGGAFLRWSQSKDARHDVNAFLEYIHQNGPVVRDLLKNLGVFLGKFAPGLSQTGATELKLISGFLGFLDKLPPGLAKPLTEVAGAALLLSRIGAGGAAGKVISFLVTGRLGGIFARGGAAGAAGAAAEGAGAASLWSRLAPGARLVGGALAMTLIVSAVLKATPSGPGGRNWWDNPFGMPGPKDRASQNNWLTSWSPYINTFKKNIAGMTHFFAGSWSGATSTVGQAADRLRTKNLAPLLGEAGKVSGGIQGLSGIMQNTLLAAERAAGQHSDNLRTRNLTPLRGEVGKVSGGIQGLSRYMHPGLSAAADTGGRHVSAFRTNNLGPLQGSLSRTSGGIQGLQWQISHLHGKTVNVGVHGTGSGGVQVTPSTGVPGARNYAVYFKPAARGLYVAAGRPGVDDQPILAQRGELIVPAPMVRAGAVSHLRGKIPGFAAGGLVGAQNAVAAAGAADAAAETRPDIRAILAKIKAAIAASQAAGAGIRSTALGGDAGANRELARKMFPWPASMWPAYVNLEMAEAGFNRFARNPSSGAYGIPQALPPTKMPFAAQAAGGSHAGPQISWMYGYIGQRYGNPVNAWAHEVAYHWYDRGGWLRPGLTLAYNGTGRPEQVIPAGRGGGGHVCKVELDITGGDQELVNLLRKIVRVKGGGDVQAAFGRR